MFLFFPKWPWSKPKEVSSQNIPTTVLLYWFPNDRHDCYNITEKCPAIWMIVAITAIYYNKTKQGSTHKYTKKGTDQRIIQNVRAGGFGDTKESPQMYPYF